MQAENKIQHLDQYYVAFSQCNRSIIKAQNEQELFVQICNDMVNHVRMRFAWIGRIDHKRRLIVPVISAGDCQENDEGDTIRILIDRLATSQLFDDIVYKKRFLWRWDDFCELLADPPQESRRCWPSSVILPLHCNSHVVGILFLCAPILDGFTESFQRCLLELVETIGFALDRFRRESAFQLVAQIVTQSNEGIMLLDTHYRIVMVNKAFTRITGYAENEVLKQNLSMVLSEEHATMRHAIEKEGYWQGEIWNRRKNGTVHLIGLRIQMMHDSYGHLTHYIGTITDLMEKKKAYARTQWFAHFDPLTGLPNRLLLHIRSTQAMSLAKRRHEPLALMFLDLDYFKQINDSFGHAIGDELLKQFAKRLIKSVREQDTVSRQGGDEFVVTLPGTDEEGATHVATRLLNTVAQPYHIECHVIHVTVSIGIAMYPTDGTDFDMLWRRADTAMYRAKQSGRNNYCFFSADWDQALHVDQVWKSRPKYQS